MVQTIEQWPSPRKRGEGDERDWARWLEIGHFEAKREAAKLRGTWRHPAEDLEEAAGRGQIRAVEYRQENPASTDDECAEQCQLEVRTQLRKLRAKPRVPDLLAQTCDEKPESQVSGAVPPSWAQFTPHVEGRSRLSHSGATWRRHFRARFPRGLADVETCSVFNGEVIDALVRDLESASDSLWQELSRAPVVLAQGQSSGLAKLREYGDVTVRLRRHRQELSRALARWMTGTLKLECKVCDPAQTWCECKHTAGTAFQAKGRPSPERSAQSLVERAADAWMTKVFGLCGIHQDAKRAKHDRDDVIALVTELAEHAQRVKREARAAKAGRRVIGSGLTERKSSE